MLYSKALTLTIKILFPLCLLSFFGLILYLIQFNHPQTDDYVVLLEVKQFGPEYLHFIYGKWSGRLLPTYIFNILASNDLIFNHYWIHTVAALVATLISAFAMLWAVHNYIVSFAVNTPTLWSYALVYLAVQITLLPEVASAYFWFSGTIVYQSTIILLQCQLALSIVWLNTRRKWLRALTFSGICLQIVLINFSNEPAVIINGILLCLIGIVCFTKNRVPAVAVFGLLYFISAYIMISAPGNANRANEIPSANMLSAVLIAGGRTGILIWHVLKNPAFWAVTFSILCLGSIHKHQFLSPGLQMLLRKYYLLLWPLAAGVIFLTLVPVMYVSNGSFPERANNLLAQVLFMLLIIAAYLTGSIQLWQIASARIRPVITAALVISIWCNDFFGSLVKSAVSAPVYDMVISQRQERMVDAANRHLSVAYVQTYESHSDSIISLSFNQERQILKKLRKEKPSALYLFDDLENDFSRTVLAHFFGLKELRVSK